MKIEHVRVSGYERIAEVIRNIGDPTTLDDLGMGEWEIRESGVYASSGASTCIILAAHNRESQKGLLGHFSSISNTFLYTNGPQFEQAVSSLDSLGQAGQTDLWLGGGSPHYMNGVDKTEPDRGYAQERVAKFLGEKGLSDEKLTVTWSRPDQVIDAVLDVDQGLLVVVDYPGSEF